MATTSTTARARLGSVDDGANASGRRIPPEREHDRRAALPLAPRRQLRVIERARIQDLHAPARELDHQQVGVDAWSAGIPSPATTEGTTTSGDGSPVVGKAGPDGPTDEDGKQHRGANSSAATDGLFHEGSS